MSHDFRFRIATADDIPRIQALIDRSVRALQATDYTPAQIEGALKGTLGVDTQLLADGTYLIVELTDASPGSPLVAAGGWSRRKTLCGGDSIAGQRDDSFLNPETEAAKIRAFYVHPDWARKGIGTRMLAACEDAARAAGFHRFEMGATLTGVPLYQLRGYTETSRFAVPLPNGEELAIVRMEKNDPGHDSAQRDASGIFCH